MHIVKLAAHEGLNYKNYKLSLLFICLCKLWCLFVSLAVVCQKAVRKVKRTWWLITIFWMLMSSMVHLAPVGVITPLQMMKGLGFLPSSPISFPFFLKWLSEEGFGLYLWHADHFMSSCRSGAYSFNNEDGEELLNDNGKLANLQKSGQVASPPKVVCY